MARRECKIKQIEEDAFLEEMEAIILWQKDPDVHPLTCGNCGNVLLPSLQDGVVVLKCRSCSYTQDNIPIQIYLHYYNEKYPD